MPGSGKTPLIKSAVAVAVIVLANLLGWGALAAPALADSSATTVNLSLSKPTIAADGREQSLATATVTDTNSTGVAGDSLAITPDSGLGNATVSAVTDHGDGTYTATITDAHVESGTVTATDSSTTSPIQSSAQSLSAVAPTVSLSSFSTPSIASDGLEHDTATATVSGPNGALSGDQLSIVSTGLTSVIGNVTDNHDGSYSVTVADNQVESGTIAVSDTSPASPVASSDQGLSVVAPTVSLALSHGSIADNGLDQTTATATVTGPNGNLTSDAVAITPSGLNGVTVSGVTNHHDGTYTATITGANVESGTVSAADDSPASPVSSSAQALSVVAPTVSLALSHPSIADNGLDQTLATATVTGPNGNLTGETVAITQTGLPNATISSVTNHGDGTYTATITDNHVESGNVTATDNTPSSPVSSSAQALSVVAPTVSLALSHPSIADNGLDQTLATATVTGPNGNLTGETVAITQTGLPNATISSVTNHGDGTYTATITDNHVESGNVTATDNTPASHVASTDQALSVVAPTVGLAVLSPGAIADDGVDQTAATVSVSGPNGALSNDAVTITPTGLSGVNVSGITNHGNGTYTATITGNQAGTATITANDTSPSATASSSGRTLTVSPVAVSVALTKNQITANGSDSSTATATVTGPNGALAGDSISFAGTNSINVGSITNHGDGTYSARLTGTHAGPSTVTATDSSPSSAVTSQGQALTLTPGPAASVSVSLTPTSVLADGNSQSTATAVVVDANGNPIHGDSFTFSATGGVVVQPNANGDAATLTSSTHPGPSTITATDTSTQAAGAATLDQVAVPSTTSLTASPSSSATNQSVHLFAAVASGSGSPSGVITFLDNGNPIGNCAGMPVSSSQLTATCTTAFESASAHQLTASFTPASGSNVAKSVSSPLRSLRISGWHVDADRILEQRPAPGTEHHLLGPGHPRPYRGGRTYGLGRVL